MTPRATDVALLSGHPAKRTDRRVDEGIERGRAVELLVDGRRVQAFEGESVAAALLAAGKRVLRMSARYGAPRGLYCGIGGCFECVTTIDGRPNVRTCQTPVRDRMRIETQKGEGPWAFHTPSKSSPRDAPRAKEPLSTLTNSRPPVTGTKCGCAT